MGDVVVVFGFDGQFGGDCNFCLKWISAGSYLLARSNVRHEREPRKVAVGSATGREKLVVAADDVVVVDTVGNGSCVVADGAAGSCRLCAVAEPTASCSRGLPEALSRSSCILGHHRPEYFFNIY